MAIISTLIGYLISDYLNKDMLVALAIVNPVYFMCMMIGSMKTLQISLSIIFGAILGPAFYFISPEWCILLGGFISGTIAFFIGEKKMTSNIFLIIVVTSLATYLSRFLGVLTSEKIKETSKIYRWFNCLAYSTLAALIARLIIFPSGALLETSYLVRLIILIISILIFFLGKKNLVYPTVFSAIILYFLNG